MGLFWKIFVSIGIAMAVTMVATVYVTFRIAEQAWQQVNIDGRDRILQEVNAALQQGGERELKAWLFKHPRLSGSTVLYVMNERGQELLGRAMPRELQRLLRIRPVRGPSTPPNLRPMQLTPHLIGPDGKEYRLFFSRAPFTFFGVLIWPGTPIAVSTIALLTAAVTALLLARYLSSPMVRLQKASRALAAGVLDARVGGPFNRRKDEIGRLARDFDTMAERVQALVTDKETLLRDVSHELRSPLARIRVALALAQRRADTAAQPDLARIEREAERLDALVGQVMTLSRLRTATAPQREVVRLDALVAEIVDDARFEHPDAQVVYAPPGAIEIFGDGAGLKSAVENVIRNALIYADGRGPIDVGLAVRDGRAVLRVLDCGPGVPPDDLAKIFEPFYRTDASRDHQGGGGQGIGLAITARVVELHGGTVQARNRAEGGLEMILTLPLGPSAKAA